MTENHDSAPDAIGVPAAADAFELPLDLGGTPTAVSPAALAASTASRRCSTSRLASPPAGAGARLGLPADGAHLTQHHPQSAAVAPQKGTMSTTDEKKALPTRWFSEYPGKGNSDVVDELGAEDVLFPGGGRA